MHVAQPQRAHDALILPGVRVVGVGEHDHKVNLVIRNARVDLLMAALIFGQEQRDRKIRRLGDKPPRRRRSRQAVLGEDGFICRAELHHEFLFLIMRHECDIHFFSTPLFTCRQASAGFSSASRAFPAISAQYADTQVPRHGRYTGKEAFPRPPRASHPHRPAQCREAAAQRRP